MKIFWAFFIINSSFLHANQKIEPICFFSCLGQCSVFFSRTELSLRSAHLMTNKRNSTRSLFLKDNEARRNHPCCCCCCSHWVDVFQHCLPVLFCLWSQFWMQGWVFVSWNWTFDLKWKESHLVLFSVHQTLNHQFFCPLQVVEFNQQYVPC